MTMQDEVQDWEFIDDQPDYQKTPPDAVSDDTLDHLMHDKIVPIDEYMQHRPRQFEDFDPEQSETVTAWGSLVGLVLILASASLVIFSIQRWVWPWAANQWF